MMSIDFYIAMHKPDLPGAATIQQCVSDRKYPISLLSISPALSAGDVKFNVAFQQHHISLDAEVTRLDESGVYQWEAASTPILIGPSANSSVEVRQLDPNGKSVPHRLADDLLKLGVTDQYFHHGDYVVTLHIGGNPVEVRAGMILTAALIRCAHGYGFEFESGTHGAASFADTLEDQAENDKYWKF